MAQKDRFVTPEVEGMFRPETIVSSAGGIERVYAVVLPGAARCGEPCKRLPFFSTFPMFVPSLSW